MFNKRFDTFFHIIYNFINCICFKNFTALNQQVSGKLQEQDEVTHWRDIDEAEKEATDTDAEVDTHTLGGRHVRADDGADAARHPRY